MMMMKSTCMAQVSIPWNAHCALKGGGTKTQTIEQKKISEGSLVLGKYKNNKRWLSLKKERLSVSFGRGRRIQCSSDCPEGYSRA
jgi:hypothetical protein